MIIVRQNHKKLNKDKKKVISQMSETSESILNASLVFCSNQSSASIVADSLVLFGRLGEIMNRYKPCSFIHQQIKNFRVPICMVRRSPLIADECDRFDGPSLHSTHRPRVVKFFSEFPWQTAPVPTQVSEVRVTDTIMPIVKAASYEVRYLTLAELASLGMLATARATLDDKTRLKVQQKQKTMPTTLTEAEQQQVDARANAIMAEVRNKILLYGADGWDIQYRREHAEMLDTEAIIHAIKQKSDQETKLERVTKVVSSIQRTETLTADQFNLEADIGSANEWQWIEKATKDWKACIAKDGKLAAVQNHPGVDDKKIRQLVWRLQNTPRTDKKQHSLYNSTYQKSTVRAYRVTIRQTESVDVLQRLAITRCEQCCRSMPYGFVPWSEECEEYCHELSGAAPSDYPHTCEAIEQGRSAGQCHSTDLYNVPLEFEFDYVHARTVQNVPLKGSFKIRIPAVLFDPVYDDANATAFETTDLVEADQILTRRFLAAKQIWEQARVADSQPPCNSKKMLLQLFGSKARLTAFRLLRKKCQQGYYGHSTNYRSVIALLLETAHVYLDRVERVQANLEQHEWRAFLPRICQTQSEQVEQLLPLESSASVRNWAFNSVEQGRLCVHRLLMAQLKWPSNRMDLRINRTFSDFNYAMQHADPFCRGLATTMNEPSTTARAFYNLFDEISRLHSDNAKGRLVGASRSMLYATLPLDETRPLSASDALLKQAWCEMMDECDTKKKEQSSEILGQLIAFVCDPPRAGVDRNESNCHSHLFDCATRNEQNLFSEFQHYMYDYITATDRRKDQITRGSVTPQVQEFLQKDVIDMIRDNKAHMQRLEHMLRPICESSKHQLVRSEIQTQKLEYAFNYFKSDKAQYWHLCKLLMFDTDATRDMMTESRELIGRLIDCPAVQSRAESARNNLGDSFSTLYDYGVQVASIAQWQKEKELMKKTAPVSAESLAQDNGRKNDTRIYISRSVIEQWKKKQNNSADLHHDQGQAVSAPIINRRHRISSEIQTDNIIDEKCKRHRKQ